jgi:hypothetical protein
MTVTRKKIGESVGLASCPRLPSVIHRADQRKFGRPAHLAVGVDIGAVPCVVSTFRVSLLPPPERGQGLRRGSWEGIYTIIIMAEAVRATFCVPLPWQAKRHSHRRRHRRTRALGRRPAVDGVVAVAVSEGVTARPAVCITRTRGGEMIYAFDCDPTVTPYSLPAHPTPTPCIPHTLLPTPCTLHFILNSEL